MLFNYKKSKKGGMELTELKHKSLQFELSGVDEEQGIFEGYASVFGVTAI